eukprot:26807_1
MFLSLVSFMFILCNNIKSTNAANQTASPKRNKLSSLDFTGGDWRWQTYKLSNYSNEDNSMYLIRIQNKSNNSNVIQIEEYSNNLTSNITWTEINIQQLHELLPNFSFLFKARVPAREVELINMSHASQAHGIVYTTRLRELEIELKNKTDIISKLMFEQVFGLHHTNSMTIDNEQQQTRSELFCNYLKDKNQRLELESNRKNITLLSAQSWRTHDDFISEMMVCFIVAALVIGLCGFGIGYHCASNGKTMTATSELISEEQSSNNRLNDVVVEENDNTENKIIEVVADKKQNAWLAEMKRHKIFNEKKTGY